MKKTSLAIFALILHLTSHGIEVESTAGQLAAALGDSAASTSELTVRGSVDASDLHYIASTLKNLRALDLSKCSISSYEGKAIDGKTTFSANTIPSGAFAATKLESVALPTEGKIEIDDLAFASTALNSIELPANIVRIGSGAFADCRSLERVVIKGDFDFGTALFKGCTTLKTADLGDLTSIGAWGFADCPVLTDIKGGAMVTSIGERSFAADTELITYPFGPKLKAIGSGAFSGCSLGSVNLTASEELTVIGPWAFSGCKELTSVVLPASLTTLGEGAFFDCTSLSEAELPEKCTVVAAYAYKDAPLSADVNIPEGVTEINDMAFKGISANTINLPSTLERIGDGAMENAANLKTVDARTLKSVPALGNDVWSGVTQSSVILNVDENVSDAFRNAAQWQDFYINPISTNAESSITEQYTLRGRIDGNMLIVKSSNEIERLAIYEASGILVADISPKSLEVTVELSTSAKTLVIVGRLIDGTVGTLKLAR